MPKLVSIVWISPCGHMWLRFFVLVFSLSTSTYIQTTWPYNGLLCCLKYSLQLFSSLAVVAKALNNLRRLTMNLRKNHFAFENSMLLCLTWISLKQLARFMWNFCEMELSKNCISCKIFTVNQQGTGKLWFNIYVWGTHKFSRTTDS